jgi:hypothetical protein
MKALQSPMAREILADPKAREQLRAFLGLPATDGASRTFVPPVVIELRTGGRTVRLKPVVVPKAA